MARMTEVKAAVLDMVVRFPGITEARVTEELSSRFSDVPKTIASLWLNDYIDVRQHCLYLTEPK